MEVISVGEDSYGRIDLDDLEMKLTKVATEPNTMLIGSFCAASNITGVLNDDLAITALLHQYGALSFWDYAAAAPYANIDVNPKVQLTIN